jgi:hypothetical protein
MSPSAAPEEREAIGARAEMECSDQELPEALGKPSADAPPHTGDRRRRSANVLADFGLPQ